MFYALLILISSFSLQALVLEPYTDRAVGRDLIQGKTYALQFYAEWCLICKQQKFMLGELASEAEFSNLKIYVVDFDFEKTLKAKYAVERQSTIILIRNGNEADRSLGLKEKDKLRIFFNQASLK